MQIEQEGVVAYPKDNDLPGLLLRVIESFGLAPASLPEQEDDEDDERKPYFAVILGLEDTPDTLWLLLRVDEGVDVDLTYRDSWSYRFMRQIDVRPVFGDVGADDNAVYMQLLALARALAERMSASLPVGVRRIPIAIGVSQHIAVCATAAGPGAGVPQGGIELNHHEEDEALMLLHDEGIDLISLEDEEDFGVLREAIPWGRVESLCINAGRVRLVTHDKARIWSTQLGERLPARELQRLRDYVHGKVPAKPAVLSLKHEIALYKDSLESFDVGEFVKRYGLSALLDLALAMRPSESVDESTYAVFIKAAMVRLMQDEHWGDALRVAARLTGDLRRWVDERVVVCHLKLDHAQEALAVTDEALRLQALRYANNPCLASELQLLKTLCLIQLGRNAEAEDVAEGIALTCPENAFALCAPVLLMEQAQKARTQIEKALRYGASADNTPLRADAPINELMRDLALPDTLTVLRAVGAELEQYAQSKAALHKAFAGARPAFPRRINLGEQTVTPAPRRPRRRFRANLQVALSGIADADWVQAMTCDEARVVLLTNKGLMLCYRIQDAMLRPAWHTDDPALTAGLTQIELIDGLLYGLGRGVGLRILDVSTGDAPGLIRDIEPRLGEGYRHFAFDKDRLACVSDYGVELFDLTRPHVPRRLGEIHTGLFDAPTGVGWCGNVLIVSFMGLRGLAGYDVSDISAPRLVQALRLSDNSDAQSHGVRVHRNRVYSRFEQGIYCVHVSDDGRLQFESLLPHQLRSREHLPAMYMEGDLMYMGELAFERHFSVLEHRDGQLRALAYDYIDAIEESFDRVCFQGDRLWGLSEGVLYRFALTQAISDEAMIEGLAAAMRERALALVCETYGVEREALDLAKRFIELDEHHDEDRSDLTDIMWALRDEYAVAWSLQAEDRVQTVGDLLAWLAEGVCISESVTRTA